MKVKLWSKNEIRNSKNEIVDPGGELCFNLLSLFQALLWKHAVEGLTELGEGTYPRGHEVFSVFFKERYNSNLLEFLFNSCGLFVGLFVASIILHRGYIGYFNLQFFLCGFQQGMLRRHRH